MKAREKKLLIGFAVVAGVVVISRSAPDLRDAFDYSKQIAEAREDLDDLEQIQSQFQDDLAQYDQYVTRTGDNDPDAVQLRIKPRIDELILACNLDRARVAPKSSEDPKTKVSTVKFSVTAEGTWADALRFVRDLYELPSVAQCTSLKLSPATRRLTEDKVKVDADLEVTVLPRMRSRNRRDPGELPEAIIKHGDPDLLAMAQPFWPPAPEPPPPPLPDEIVVEPPGPSEPPRNFDPLRDEKFVIMVWTYGRSEVTIGSRVNPTLRETKLIGDDLDGGTIIWVHPLGAVTRTEDGEEFFYPTGERLADCVPVETATAYPEILVGVANLRALEDLVGPPAPWVDSILDRPDRVPGMEPEVDPMEAPYEDSNRLDEGTHGTNDADTNGAEMLTAETAAAGPGAEEGPNPLPPPPGPE